MRILSKLAHMLGIKVQEIKPVKLDPEPGVHCRDCGKLMDRTEVRNFLGLGLIVQRGPIHTQEALCVQCALDRAMEDNLEDLMAEFCG